jgi:ribonuclease R
MVMVEITQFPARHRQPRGAVLEVLGEHLDPGMEIDVAIRSHGIPHVFPEEVLAESGSLAPEPSEKDKKQRNDLRKMAFVTIDGEDARDFDDAVYCEARRGEWTLWVAIADVSHYVRPGSALDVEAQLRATSVYFPEQVVPMLPEALSNGLCSLKPRVDRLSLVCEMQIGVDGKLGKFAFSEAVIHSHARLTYTQVGAALAGEPDHGVEADVLPHLKELHKLYKCLRTARDKRGAIEFDTVETRIVFDANRKIEAIVPVVRNDAHKLIEECMLSANVATARFLESQKLPALYRVHEGPTEEKLASLREYLGQLSLELGGGDKPDSLDYCRLQQQLGDREDAHLIQIMMLRSFKQAMYQPDNKGHFGLNYPAYAHFTSPIRRYPDLLVHRAIRAVIRSDMPCDTVHRMGGAKPIPIVRGYPYQLPEMLAQGEHCSMAERRADEATREVDSWLKCEYLQDHVGEVFPGVVSATTSFGLFVELDGLYVEGLVHISALPGDYYHFDSSRQRLTGERSGRTFQLGDKVIVQVARVDLDDKKVDFELVESTSRAKKSGKKQAPAPSSPRKRKAKQAGKATGSKKKPGSKTTAAKKPRKRPR